MVQKLASLQPPLVLYRKHHGVLLTAAGKRGALAVIRHHRLLETWLVRSLGYSWDRVHGEAENLEHAISDEMERRISAALGDPERDPHGDPIPSRDLRMPPDHSIRLTELGAGQEAVVSRVHSQDPDLLRHLGQLGVTPGAEVKVLDLPQEGQPISLEVGGARGSTVMKRSAAAHILVDPK
jgi:DtxR family Mn-dependent transcriptional regulator